ncbi:MAG: hypothetical protein ACFB3T_08720 [Geminicoccaceae bacterium]
MRRFVPVLAALAVCAALPAFADDVLEQIDLAKSYYEEGDYTGAVTELQFAINAIKGRTNELYVETMPPAPSGWQAQEPEMTGGGLGALGGQMITRRYVRDGAPGEITAELMVDNPMIQAIAAMAANPAIIASQPNTERVRINRENAILQWHGQGAGEVSLVLGGRVLAKLSGEQLEGEDILVDMMRTWDLDRIKDIAGL